MPHVLTHVDWAVTIRLPLFPMPAVFLSLLAFAVPIAELAGGKMFTWAIPALPWTFLSSYCWGAAVHRHTQTHRPFSPHSAMGSTKHQQGLGAGIWKQQHLQYTSWCLPSACWSSPGAQQYAQSCPTPASWASTRGWKESWLKTHTPLLRFPPHLQVSSD